MSAKPEIRPQNPCFSSGPCAKRPGWTPSALGNAILGRSHRSKPGKARLKLAIDLTREILDVPDDYRIGIMAGSDTGAVEAALWSLLGARGVDVLAWESFSQDWVTDIVKQLKVNDTRVQTAEYGSLPDLSAVDFERDVVFVWNGTTSGVKLPDGDWIAADRKGLTICDATSAAFAMPLPWDKLDAVTYSWQKVLGGEGGHGVIILSPRAIERLQTYTPPWPMPKIFRMAKGGKVDEAIFTGATINTPSMLCVEDYVDALTWAKDLGGLDELIARSRRNFAVIDQWVQSTDWIEFLAQSAESRSNTSVCLKIVAPWFTALNAEQQGEATKKITSLLDKEGVAFDIDAYRAAPPGFRVWAGATVEQDDLRKLLPWLEWAYQQVANS
ncbi:MAG: phosphoserine transaminase [Gammaproteobacteria bacterium]|nr:phosphoserine transaminase [Gammaproteobacteria bacterium]